MARAIVATEQRAAFEPLYDIDPRTGASIEVFYCDGTLARAFGGEPGWYWWGCYAGCLPDSDAVGPFAMPPATAKPPSPPPPPTLCAAMP